MYSGWGDTQHLFSPFTGENSAKQVSMGHQVALGENIAVVSTSFLRKDPDTKYKAEEIYFYLREPLQWSHVATKRLPSDLSLLAKVCAQARTLAGRCGVWRHGSCRRAQGHILTTANVWVMDSSWCMKLTLVMALSRYPSRESRTPSTILF